MTVLQQMRVNEMKCEYLFLSTIFQVSCFTLQLCLRVGIYHGDEIMCSPQNTKPAYLIDSCVDWDEQLAFDLKLSDIPRMARLCFLLYACDKRANKKGAGTVGRKFKDGRQEIVTLSWLNLSLFDYRDMLRTGDRLVYMWPITDDSLLSEELLNPIGRFWSWYGKYNSGLTKHFQIQIQFRTNKTFLNPNPSHFKSKSRISKFMSKHSFGW